MNEHLKVTIVFISHDPDDKQYARSLIVLSDGRITEESRG
jgi:ABC-type sulfate/molybdate transport systems ATPase subunit